MQIKIVLVSLGLVSPIVSAAAISLPMLSKAVVMSVFSPLVSAAVVVDKNKVYETEVWENAVWKDVCASYRTGLLRIQKLMSTNATRPASERRLLIKKQTRILAEYTSQLQYLFSLKLKSRRNLAALLRQRNVMLDSYKEQTPGRFDTEKERRVFRRILAQLIARIRRRFRRNLSKQQQQGSFDAQGQKLMNQFTKSINGLRKSLFVKIRTIRKINKAIPSVI